MTKELTCICCPMGCRLSIELDDGTGDILSVTGNTCKRGHDYGISELTAPVRMVTGIRLRWLLDCSIRRPICGTARPINDTGPQ